MNRSDANKLAAKYGEVSGSSPDEGMAKSIATKEVIRTEWITYQSIEIHSNDVYLIQKTHSKITELLFLRHILF